MLRNRALRDAVSERRPVDQLHHQRTNAARLLEAVDVRDILMIQRRERFGLTLKAGDALGSDASASGRISMATSRPSLVSLARQTSPIPPDPRCDTTS